MGWGVATPLPALVVVVLAVVLDKVETVFEAVDEVTIGFSDDVETTEVATVGVDDAEVVVSGAGAGSSRASTQ